MAAILLFINKFIINRDGPMIQTTSWRRMDVLKLMMGVISVGVAFLFFNVTSAEAATKVDTGEQYVPASTAEVPVGTTGGGFGAFSSLVQKIKKIGLDTDEIILSGKLKPVEYDRNLNRLVVYVAPNQAAKVNTPEKVFDEMEVYVNGFNIRDLDMNSKTNWRLVRAGENGKLPVYAFTVYTGNVKIKAKATPTFGVKVHLRDDAAVGAKNAWTVWVPKNGVTTWSKQTGHKSYGPSAKFIYQLDQVKTSAVDIDVLDVRANAEGENNEIGDFTIEFSVTAADEAVYIKKNAAQTSKNVGVQFTVDGPSEEGVSSAMSSLASTEGLYYVVDEGETEEFEVNTWIKSTVAGAYRVTLDNLQYQTSPSGKVNQIAFSPAADYRTPYVYLTGASSTTNGTLNMFVNGKLLKTVKDVTRDSALKTCRATQNSRKASDFKCEWKGNVLFNDIKSGVPTCKLSVSSDSITQGEGVTLTWSAVNAAGTAFLTNDLGYKTEIDPNNIQANRIAKPSKDTIFTLEIQSDKGVKATCTASVNVISSAGEVKGVSIDVYSQIGATIEALLGHFRSLEANSR